jgi:hypothetical protein
MRRAYRVRKVAKANRDSVYLRDHRSQHLQIKKKKKKKKKASMRYTAEKKIDAGLKQKKKNAELARLSDPSSFRESLHMIVNNCGHKMVLL